MANFVKNEQILKTNTFKFKSRGFQHFPDSLAPLDHLKKKMLNFFLTISGPFLYLFI